MISVQIESFERAIPEIRKLIGSHWNDLALLKERIPLDPQWEEYVRRERDGRLFLATVRKNGDICAYYIAQVAPGFHYRQTLTGHMDIMYIVQNEKGQGLSFPLMRCVEREFRRRGTQVWYSGWKTDNANGMDRLHGLLGFKPADTYVMKWLGE